MRQQAALSDEWELGRLLLKAPRPDQPDELLALIRQQVKRALRPRAPPPGVAKFPPDAVPLPSAPLPLERRASASVRRGAQFRLLAQRERPAQLVSQRPEQRAVRQALPSLQLPWPSFPLRRPLRLPQARGNASARARRARCQSSWSASSFR
jgi:hypothetical protein